MTWITPRTWTAGELVTATEMNTHVRDNLNAVKGFIPTSFSGMVLRTHPDWDKTFNQVSLLGLEQAVMSDGIRYSGVSQLPLTADITVSGLGGLDTGVRTASKWYEIYLIGKSSTQANSDLGLLFHRAKAYPIDQATGVTVSNFSNLRQASNALVKLAESFVAGATGLCELVDMDISKTGTPTGNVWLTIEADTSGHPSGTPLATSDRFNVAKFPTSAQIVRVPFRTPATLTSGTTYWVVWQGDYTFSAVNYLGIGYQNVGHPYPSGSLSLFDGTSWASQALNFYLNTFITVASAALTLPLGYDESCKLGYVYNTAGNSLGRFSARDRLVRNLDGGNFFSLTGTTTPTFVDLSLYIPPGPVVLACEVGSNVATNAANLMNFPEGFETLAANTGVFNNSSVFLSWVGGSGGSAQAMCPEIETEFQSAYGYVSTDTAYWRPVSYRW